MTLKHIIMYTCSLRYVEKDGEDKSSSVKEEGTGLSQLEIFQLILQKQCEAIINLGVDPSIKVSKVIYAR